MKSEINKDAEVIVHNLVRPYNLKQLADLYKVSRHTMRRWLARFTSELGKERKSRIFTAKQVKLIFDKLGNPENKEAA